MALKEKLLEILEENRPKTVSGQELAERLNVSRTAVWKAVNALKREGHFVEATPNLGYCLAEKSDVLTEAGIKTALRHQCDVRVYGCVESTNLTAKLAAVEGAKNGTIIAANEQTGGKGRRGRSFYSPKNSGVYFSIILKPQISAAESVLLTTSAAVATAEAIEELTGKEAKIKWINDIYIDKKKCVGILSEAIFDYESGGVDSVIVGIGINVSTDDFPDNVKDIACSIGTVSRNKLVALVADKLIDICDVLPNNAHLEKYRKRCFVLGSKIKVITTTGEYFATAKSIDGQGKLIVTDENGKEIALSNEEVSIKAV